MSRLWLTWLLNTIHCCKIRTSALGMVFLDVTKKRFHNHSGSQACASALTQRLAPRGETPPPLCPLDSHMGPLVIAGGLGPGGRTDHKTTVEPIASGIMYRWRPLTLQFSEDVQKPSQRTYQAKGVRNTLLRAKLKEDPLGLQAPQEPFSFEKVFTT